MHPFLYRLAAFLQLAALPALISFPRIAHAELPSKPKISAPADWLPPVPVYSSNAKLTKVATAAPIVFATRFGETPTDDELRASGILGIRLTRLTRTGLYSGNRSKLARALEEYVKRAGEPTSVRFEPLNDYLKIEPISDISASIYLEIGVVASRTAHFTLALRALSSAWQQTRGELGNGPERDLAERTLNELLSLYLRLGQKDDAANLLKEVANRPHHIISTAPILRAKILVDSWNLNPLKSVECGVVACNIVAQTQQIQSITRYTEPLRSGELQALESWGSSLSEREKAQLIELGLSGTQLRDRAQTVNPNWTWIKRTQGELVPVPSVAHLAFGGKNGHYTAVLDADATRVRIEDPYLEIRDWIEYKALNSNSSGFFLIPNPNNIPEGYRLATSGEMDGIYGRTTCPNGRDGEGDDDDGDDCENSPPPPGMMVAKILDYLPGIQLKDRPLSYVPPFGPTVDLMVKYKSTDLTPDASSHLGLGIGWRHGLHSYIESTAGTPLPASYQGIGGKRSISAVKCVTPDAYYEYQSGEILGELGSEFSATFISRYKNRPRLLWTGDYYILRDLDGSERVFAVPDGAIPHRYYLSSIRDRWGNTVQLQYEADGQWGVRLRDVVDATGRDTNFSYIQKWQSTDSGVPYAYSVINSITDPYGRSAFFTYDEDGRLTSVRDAVNMVSSVEYDDEHQRPDRIRSFTTPYGQTQFTYEGEPSLSSRGWAITIQDPEGLIRRKESLYHDGGTAFTSGPNPELRPPENIQVGDQMVRFYAPKREKAPQDAPPPPEDDPPPAVKTPLTLVPQLDHFHVTLSWNSKQWREYQKAGGDRSEFAETTLWLTNIDSRTRNVKLAHKIPGHSAVWYNYPNQPKVGSVGNSTQPIRVAWITEDEDGVSRWVMQQMSYTDNDLISEFVDEFGAKRQFVYYSSGDGSNLNYIREEIDGQSVVVSNYGTGTTGDYIHGYPTLISGIDGLSRSIGRNANGQITSVETTGNGYYDYVGYTYGVANQGAGDQNGYLTGVIRYTDPPQGQWILNDGHGRVRYAGSLGTDDVDFRTLDYDDLDRLTLVTYQDGTTEQYVYERLDVAAYKDRGGRWTRYFYNNIGQKVMEIAADGRTQQYEWCSCGSLSKYTDAEFRTTSWARDIMGRVTAKTLPDGTFTAYRYLPYSAKLAAISYPNAGGGDSVSYSYFIDGKIASERYAGANGDEKNGHVRYGYETGALRRLKTIVEDAGVWTYKYNDLSPSTLGAGKVASIDGPLKDDLVKFSYDGGGRLSGRTLLKDDGITILRHEVVNVEPSGRTLSVVNGLGTFTFGYDTGLPRVDRIMGPGGLLTQYGYYPANSPGGNARQLKSIDHSVASTPVASHQYSYDPAGRIAQWRIGVSASTNSEFRYNLSDELQSSQKTQADGTVTDRQVWSTDAVGNWISVTKGSTNLTETRSHNSLNQLKRIGGVGATTVLGRVNEYSTVKVNGEEAELRPDLVRRGWNFKRTIPVQEGENTIQIEATDTVGEKTIQSYEFTVPGVTRVFNYDANGNTLSDGDREMTWDTKNRLISVKRGGTTWKWDYDCFDHRIREYENASLQKIFIWSGNDLIQERNPDNVPLRTHYFGGFMEGAEGQGGVQYRVLGDHLGNVREVLASDGGIAARYEYTPFQGPIKVGASTVDASFQTIGTYYHHQGSGLELSFYRAYDANLGRWLSRDPLGEEGGINLYGYVGNNPINDVDPLGLSPTDNIDGYKVQVHKNDVDPWPSSPHGHIYDKNLVVDTDGKLYNKTTGQAVGKIGKKWMGKLSGLFSKVRDMSAVCTALSAFHDQMQAWKNQREYRAMREAQGASPTEINQEIRTQIDSELREQGLPPIYGNWNAGNP